MNKIFTGLSIVGVILLTSCTQKEQSKEDNIKGVTEIYINDFFKDETDIAYVIDSLIIKDITEKLKLENEALYNKKIALKTLNEAKSLGKDYKEKKDLHDIMLSASNGTKDAFITSSQNDLDNMKSNFEDLQAKTLEYSNNAQLLAQKSFTADSLQLLYYDVVVRTTMTSTATNVQKKGVMPFHISKDYKIIKEPLELRQK